MRKNAKLPRVIGKKIRKIRTNTGFTQEDLAHKIGISRVYMGYIEQGRHAPSIAVIEKVAKALKVPVDEFFR